MRAAGVLVASLLVLVLVRGAAADGGGRGDDVVLSGGQVWTTVPNGVASVDVARGTVADTIRTGLSAGFVTRLAGGRGRLWQLQSRTLVEIDPSTRRVKRKVRLPRRTYSLDVGYGRVWLPSFPDDMLLAVVARTGRLQRAIRMPHSPQAIVVGGGFVWVASVGRWHKGRGGVMIVDGKGILTRISPATNRASAHVAVGRGPTAVTVGHGSVWVVCGRGINAASVLDRVDLRTSRVVASVRLPDSSTAVAVGGRYVWVISEPRSAGGVLTRVDPATNHVLSRPIPHSWAPAAVIETGDRVWVADPGVAQLIGLDTRTLRVVSRIRLPRA
jgi:DNA-binding beta-propeller fold protein YncE